MRTLSGPLTTATGQQVTRPGYLVNLHFSVPLLLSTIGDVTWATYLWADADVRVSGISQDGKGASKAALALGNSDNVIGAIVLGEGASDTECSIWYVDASATGAADPVQVFSGVLDGAQIDEGKVTFDLSSARNKALFSPRVTIAPPTFNFLQPAGTRINVGGTVFVLERA